MQSSPTRLQSATDAKTGNWTKCKPAIGRIDNQQLDANVTSNWTKPLNFTLDRSGLLSKQRFTILRLCACLVPANAERARWRAP